MKTAIKAIAACLAFMVAFTGLGYVSLGLVEEFVTWGSVGNYWDIPRWSEDERVGLLARIFTGFFFSIYAWMPIIGVEVGKSGQQQIMDGDK